MADIPLSRVAGGVIAELNQVEFFNPAAGTTFTDSKGQKWLRSGSFITDTSLLDPSLTGDLSYGVVGGRNTFSQELGTVVASTVNNANGTVLVFDNGTADYWRSADNGETFTALTIGSANIYAIYRDCAAFSPTTGTALVAQVNSGGIYRSTDDGATFSDINITGGTSDDSVSVFFDSTGVGYCSYSIGGTDYIYTSSDDGLTWTQRINTNSDGQMFSFAEDDQGRVYAVGQGSNIYYTDDNGANWSTAAKGNNNIHVCISFVGNDTLIAAVNNNGLPSLISVDRGLTWNTWDNGIPLLGIRALWSDGNGRVVLGQTEEDYSGTKDRTVIYESTDYGGTLNQTTTVEMRGGRGLSEGADGRLFLTSTIYDATDYPEPYAYIDKGFGIGTSTIGGATGYVRYK